MSAFRPKADVPEVLMPPLANVCLRPKADIESLGLHVEDKGRLIARHHGGEAEPQNFCDQPTHCSKIRSVIANVRPHQPGQGKEALAMGAAGATTCSKINSQYARIRFGSRSIHRRRATPAGRHYASMLAIIKHILEIILLTNCF